METPLPKTKSPEVVENPSLQIQTLAGVPGRIDVADIVAGDAEAVLIRLQAAQRDGQASQ